MGRMKDYYGDLANEPKEPLVPREAFQITRRDDPDTSYEAADRVVLTLPKTQREVLEMMQKSGPMTDLELDRACRLAYGKRGYSTYRSRRKELTTKGLLRDSGERKIIDGTSRIIWELVKQDKVGVR
jgi:hypothetical protein